MGEVTMNKEVETLKRLKQEDVNIQLIFLKDLLDRQMVSGNVGEEYAIKYGMLSEIQKWELAKVLEKAYKYNVNAWNDEMQYAIDVMETRYYNEEDQDNG